MTDGPLSGIRVVEAATLFAGPLAGTHLADFGADVVKIEHPQQPDSARTHGASVDGIGLWWKAIGRNKRMITLDLSDADGQDVALNLLADADVLIENFRPGTLERWNLAPDFLLERNPRLVIARVTTFGQHGPYSSQPGFGSLAEAMSGFAAVTGAPDGPPTLPPFGLADGVTALATAFAVLAALRERDRSGRGQIIDMAIIEPMIAMLGGQLTAYDKLGVVPPRMGNRSANNAPRNLYRTRDGRWLAVSTSSHRVAERVMALVGRADVCGQPWFGTGAGRAAHGDELDAAVAEWIAERDADDVRAQFAEAQAAIGPVYDASDIVDDPQLAAIGTTVRVEDPDLGSLLMQNVLFRLSRTPGTIRWTAREHGADTDAVLTSLGLPTSLLTELRDAGVI